MMFDGNGGPDLFFPPHEEFRQRLSGLIENLTVELTRQSRRNFRQIDFLCAEIDRLTRGYLLFLGQVNAARVQQENAAKTAEETAGLRRVWGAASSRINLFRLEINKWPTIRALVHEQRKPKRQALYHQQSKIPATTFSQMGASDDVFHWLHAMLNPAEQSADAQDHACFPDIALANSEFHEHMHAAYRVALAQKRGSALRFLDVGCGGGLKVLTANRYFPKADGFDFDPAYVAAAQRLIALDDRLACHVFQQDALTYEGYGSYDVIYFYRPISDEPVLMEMERRIIAQARPGTILIAPYVSFPERHQELGCGHIDGAVYVAGMSPRKADLLRIKAERVGQYIVKPDQAPLRSIWAALLQVSRSNGFDIPDRYTKPKY
ncbi:MAG: SAM-dependent methyltransferase [Sulfitobacter sp.]|jgi:SAM-dependent methyltransferase